MASPPNTTLDPSPQDQNSNTQPIPSHQTITHQTADLDLDLDPATSFNDTTNNERDEAAQLASLGAGIRDQDDLERDIGRQADQLLLEQADERDKKRLEKTQKDKDRFLAQVRLLQQKLGEFGNHATKNRYRASIEEMEEQVKVLDVDLEQIQTRMSERRQVTEDAEEEGGAGEVSTEEVGANRRLPGESQREFLIRTGKITPFSKMGRQLLKTSSSLGDVLLDAEDEEGEDDREDAEEEGGEDGGVQLGPTSHRNLLAPGFDQDDSTATTSVAGDTDGDAEMARRLQEEEFAANQRPAKRRRVLNRGRRQIRAAMEEEDVDRKSPVAVESDDYAPASDSGEDRDDQMKDFVVDEEGSDGEPALPTEPGIKRRGKTKKQRSRLEDDGDAEQEDLAGIDDGNENVYQARLQSWVKRRRAARLKFKKRQHTDSTSIEEAEQDEVPAAEDTDAGEKEEWHMPHPTRTDATFDGGLRVPGDIYPSLFDYQKTGVQWLWELYSQQVGGIIGDEMGLGKTIQVIAFLAGLHYSGKLNKPIVVVCPATVMKQWVNEFHRWWPPLRVSILHTSGSGMLDVRREARFEDDLEDMGFQRRSTTGRSQKGAKKIVDKVVRDGHVLVTTYSGLQTYAELLIPIDWEYAVLDEGHKIRNPNTAITIYCKELRTHNRVILSGTPMQNNLTELWSLFDFIFPMRLGTLVNFRNQFEIPIKQGGYANASNLQVETAMKCAETLKDAISPYLLQRFKVDVAADLPRKSERVLFCRLTKLQRDAYEWFLASEDMKSIMAGKRQALYGVDILRKICNHPDLVEHKTLSKKVGYNYGAGTKSGKMQVVKALLEIWKRGGHKTLLFAQHRIMLDILETFVGGMEGFKYRRMDGNTSIKDRQDLVDEFNRDPDIHVFLLTTKVGGLGVNLTGADRVIIYDPDWNPSTDVQARERAWRLGQKREVEIYRLMTAGTIEEKIYHRQIFKQFLTNKILRDPKQRQTFQLRDLHDLFTLGETQEGGQTETSSIFKGTEVQLSGAAKDKGKAKAKANTNAIEQSLPTPPESARENGDDREAVNEIVGVSRQEDYRGNASEEEEDIAAAPTEQQPSTKDDRMLSSIFARSGVHSALEHDAIISGNGTRKTVRADPEIIARAAKKVAEDAARELQRAGEVARTVPAGQVTWTGTYGTAPEDFAPVGRGGVSAGRGGRGGAGRGGPSSASVMANLQSRQAGVIASPSTTNATSSRLGTPTTATTPSRRDPRARNAEEQLQGKDFLVAIRDFLLAQGGRAYTQMLIDHFQRFCRTEERTAEFKEMLKTIAVLERGQGGRGRGGRGMWRLRDEYTPRTA